MTTLMKTTSMNTFECVIMQCSTIPPTLTFHNFLTHLSVRKCTLRKCQTWWSYGTMKRMYLNQRSVTSACLEKKLLPAVYVSG